MTEKIYYNTGFLNKVKEKKSDKAPDYRSNIILYTDTLDAIIAAGGKISLAGWLYQGNSVRLSVSADNYVKPAQEPAKANGYQEEVIPF